MTRSGAWLAARASELARRELLAAVLLALGWLLAALAVGVRVTALAREGAELAALAALAGAWALVVLALGLGLARYRRACRRRSEPARLAEQIERSAGLRAGWVVAASLAPGRGSPVLADLADQRVAGWLEEHGEAVLAVLRRQRARQVQRSALVAAGGAALFLLSGSSGPAGSEFWRPLAVIGRWQGPVQLVVPATQVRRGQSLDVKIVAPGRRRATLWSRAPGESWTTSVVTLDSTGQAVRTIGPLHSDRFLKATSGGRQSPTIEVRVSLPVLLAQLELVARYPDYLERPDEPLAPGPEPRLVPVGTEILARGQLTVPVERAAWRLGGQTVPVRVAGTAFEGRWRVSRSGRLELLVQGAGGQSPEGDPPAVELVAVPDSAPVIAVPVPGVDTTAPLSLLQPLVVDVRDDHRVRRVELLSRRASRLGRSGPVRIDSLPLPAGGAERVVLQWTLDLTQGGYLPGDTAYYRVRAWDDAPQPHRAESREYRLRLLSHAELRGALREVWGQVARAAQSLAAEQRAASQAAEELAAERERASGGPGDRAGSRAGESPLPYQSAERARALAEREQQVVEQARQLAQRVRELAQAAAQAGLADSEWQAQLRELERLVQRAVTPELARRLDELRRALERLDPEAVRQALARLAASGQELREQLERSRQLLERAAIEGTLTTLAQDARELAQRQAEWAARAAAQAPDTSAAREEQALAGSTDSLASQVDRVRQDLERRGASIEPVAEANRDSRQAAGAMERAAAAAAAGESAAAWRSGEAAREALDRVSQRLLEQRDAVRQQWRREVVEALDQALQETAELARRQLELAQRLERGETSAAIRGAQAALREGADRVLQRLQAAAGKNALISPQIGSALGFARLRMSEALDRLQRANPSPRDAADLAGQAVDGLNATAQSLLSSRAEVQGAQSGSGLAEALEKMARLAAEQQALNARAGGMLPLVPLGGEALMADLRALAERQRRLAAELERLGAHGEPAAQELAQEARDLARRLEAGQLDRRVIERQERLFRRLLDQGRTLQGDEDDEQRERVSRTARPDNVRLPPAHGAAIGAPAPQYPYPTWEQLQHLPPDQRRLVLDYFRRLNAPRTP